jgi:hypothetical protein
VAKAPPILVASLSQRFAQINDVHSIRRRLMDQSPMVTGLFNDRESAEHAYNAAAERGYGKDDINLMMSEETKQRHFHAGADERTELGSKAAEGAGIGGAIGHVFR